MEAEGMRFTGLNPTGSEWTTQDTASHPDETRAMDVRGWHPMWKRSTIVAVVVILVGALGALPAGAEHADRFLGTWRSVDADGSNQWLTVSEDAGTVEVRLLDDDATGACDSGGPATLEGGGEISADGATLHVTFETLDCHVSDPTVDPPVGVDYVHDPIGDTLTDDFDVVWHRQRQRGPRDPYVGTWVTTDLVDGSDMSVTFGGGGGDRQFRFADLDATGACDTGGLFTAEGTGEVSGDGSTFVGTFGSVRCADGTDRADLVGFVIGFTHDQDTNTLDSGTEIWHRP